MRFLLLFTLGFRLAVPLLAQEPTKNFIEIKLKSNQYKAVAYLEEPGRTDGGSTLLFSGKDFLAFWDVNSDFTDYTETAVVPSAKFQGVGPGTSMLPMAHYAQGGKLFVLAQYKPPATTPGSPVSLYLITYDPSTKTVTGKKDFVLEGRTTIHAALSLGTEMWLLTSHATRDHLVIRRFSGPVGLLDTTAIDVKALGLVAEPPIKKKETAVGQALRRAETFGVFYPNTDRDLSNGLTESKLFVESDRVSILLLVGNMATEKRLYLLEINRNNMEAKLKTREGVFNYETAGLEGEFLITFQAVEGKAELKWWDRETFQTVKTYTITTTDEEITFINRPPLQEGGATIYASDKRDLVKPAQVVRKLANGTQKGITTRVQKDGKIQVTFGSYSEIVQSYNFNQQFMFNPAINPAFKPPVPTSFGRFGPASPGEDNPAEDYPTGPVLIGDAVRASASSKVITLVGLFDPLTAEHVKGTISPNPYDRVFGTIDASFSSVQTFCNYTDAINLYLVYYDKNKKGILRTAYPKP